jgi:hypothetical protein
MNFRDIPPLTKSSSYACDVGWGYLPTYVEDAVKGSGLDLNPDFQRGHVWTEDQQRAYVEYALRDGSRSGKDLFFNCKNWQRTSNIGPYVIVDGLQRLTAALKFMDNKLKAYGHYLNEFEGKLRLSGPSFRWHVNDLAKREDVLKWYLEFNSGGTPHSNEELERVRKLYEEEVANKKKR